MIFLVLSKSIKKLFLLIHFIIKFIVIVHIDTKLLLISWKFFTNIKWNCLLFFTLLFKQVHDGKNLKGRANDAIASACLYIACRQEGVPRTFKEICAVSKISKKEIGRCFKLILKALETSVDLITTADFMSRFCSNLGLPNSVQRAATHIARKAGELDIVSGRSPISVAAAAIYMASQVRHILN